MQETQSNQPDQIEIELEGDDDDYSDNYDDDDWGSIAGCGIQIATLYNFITYIYFILNA